MDEPTAATNMTQYHQPHHRHSPQQPSTPLLQPTHETRMYCKLSAPCSRHTTAEAGVNRNLWTHVVCRLAATNTSACVHCHAMPCQGLKAWVLCQIMALTSCTACLATTGPASKQQRQDTHAQPLLHHCELPGSVTNMLQHACARGLHNTTRSCNAMQSLLAVLEPCAALHKWQVHAQTVLASVQHLAG